MSKSDNPLFSHHEHALEKEYQVCPECGSELSIKHGKSGPFLGCVNYPSCAYTRPVVENERVEDKILQGSECPKCNHNLAVKQGRYGMFIGCSNFPDCDYIEHDEPNELADISCPSCKKGLIKEKTSRFGKKFYSCDAYPKCKFIVNFEPVVGTCQQCDYPLLLKRNMAAGVKYQCASKKCSAMQTITS
ncbi:topoisomerase DNA-binding C4 zinc finger domain-containing protein [Colwellia sp. 4_MG-2023]|uniref:DNA topoisomerase family protein n=1 Tax=unclassified Colwellia TaxID=196834 RepID=UPI0026E23C92|nr:MULTISPECIES: topoisomerase DNA-binding C4 zinc finger domain-containing protein [unclassified Colwellia]MDO6486065.1 topoisomerase DNA-binding C4 zinc finger domain-containing protein [Colwellia sp. 6_MG-2023]MDO6505978.1 topoisomerase DNA-binding C4 zinc finger domain-containing protein [Colwellia sp. 5_MG-2023]MDO6554659.1 topoisomerase DNA-binding C4 zinc finger domain-containing protein [Colwellia sp. 4_MG-2023]